MADPAAMSDSRRAIPKGDASEDAAYYV
jgi:hypothetical protein